MEKMQLFLSHISAESQLADLIERHVVQDFIGLVDVFESSDHTSIPAGSKWLDEITKALNRANLHIVLASADSLEQKWINFEAGAAHVRGIPVLPVCHSGLKPVQLPPPLSESQAVDLSSAAGFEQFYKTIADALGSDTPHVDFSAYVDEVNSFETAYAARRNATQPSGVMTSSEVVMNPAALCISSKQFLDMGFANQLQKVVDAFPSTVSHTRVSDSMAVREALGTEQFAIVHIAAFICPRSGSLYFSDVNLQTGRPISETGDSMGADEFVDLVQRSKTRLAVITSCNALSLAAPLTMTCHVVTAREMISPNQMATWVDEFYHRLQNESLSSALKEAIVLSGARMVVYARQPEKVDLTMQRSAATAAVG